MRVGIAGLAWLALAACAQGGHGPQTMTEILQTHDWQYDRGGDLVAALDRDFARLARQQGRAATLAKLQAAGYACSYGEGHEDYPEPAAVCTRSFATRACQMDWEVSLTSDPARPDSVDWTDAGFRRDCVGTADDWPEPITSEIDSQLAPAAPPDAS
jgi:hypothetical protein